MKLLIHSNGPDVPTGYGVQTRYLVERLALAGHDVAVSCTYGHQGGLTYWQSARLREAGIEPLRVYPNGWAMFSNDMIAANALHHFDGDPKAGWIIPLLDVWSLEVPLFDFQAAAWTPIDHVPCPPQVKRFFDRSGAHAVAMSKFGQDELLGAGVDADYIPLTVDTKAYLPRREESEEMRRTLGLPANAFVVGMVAMNKGWARDRKGFNEAFRAFGRFWREHRDAVLYVHADWTPVCEGMDLRELAIASGIPEQALVFPPWHAYRLGFQPDQMAATYSAMDVLLAPSHGEGFCVPLLEAQACGTPVIASNFSSQPELVGAGWLVDGQEEWDPAQHASYMCPFTASVVKALESAYAADFRALMPQATLKAAQYDTDKVFAEAWLPFLELLEAKPEPIELGAARLPMPDENAVAVIVPKMRDTTLLEQSFHNTNDGSARLHIVNGDGTFAEKVNQGLRESTEPWVLIVGDDCEFIDGWIEAARAVSDRFDVVGTNDTDSEVIRNQSVAAGRHADHFFVRRSYIEELGASLEGPGALASEEYGHFFTDVEIVELAKARGVFTPCLRSVIVHHHPAYEGVGARDEVYMLAQERGAADQATWDARRPLIRMQRRAVA